MQRDAQLTSGLKRLIDAVSATTAARQKLEHHLAEREVALRLAAERTARDRQAELHAFSKLKGELEAALTEQVARCRALEGKLAQAEASHLSAEQLWHDQAAALADTVSRQQAEFSAILEAAIRERDALGERESALIWKLEDAATTQARLERYLSDNDSALRDAEQRLADAILSLGQGETNRQALEKALAAATEALRATEQRAEAERQSAASEKAQSQTRFESELSNEITRRQAVEKDLADARAHSKQVRLGFLSKLEDAATTQARLERCLSDNGSALRDAEQRLADATLSLARMEQQATAERQSATEEAAQLYTRFETALNDEITRRQAVEKELADTRAASEQVRLGLEQRAAAEREAGAEDTRRRQAEHDAELARGETGRQALEKALAAATEALRATEQRAEAERQTAVKEAAQSQARFETALNDEITRRQAVEKELADTRAASEQARLSLLEQLTATRQYGSRLEERAERERAEWESTQAEDRERIQQLQIEGDLGRRSLVAAEEQNRRLQSAHEEERANFERARLALEEVLVGERTRLESLVAERDTQLKTLAKELDATRSQRDALKIDAGLVPQIRKQLEQIRAESRGHFDNSPVNICRLNRSGDITRVNQALATLLGYDGPEHVQNTDFATRVFEVAGELRWLVDRCFASRSLESVETTWRRKDGTRLIVRVLAIATSAESIDLTAHDLTAFRDLEEKLRYARRLEAVARYASEVAVNCESLLAHVRDEGERWLTTLDAEAARHQGQSLLAELTRVAGFLRQLQVVGNEQKKVPELVEVNKVLRDMAPVLKQVAGSNIELVLPKASSPLNLDVEAERVERVLVNVAAYGRERMPLGGRMTIEVASVVLDRNFVAKHPNVRPGPHVLLTVNEVRGASSLPAGAQMFETKPLASHNPGVDLGALQALVSDCGGHLWMMAEPPGDMVLKIHLPRRALDRPDTPPSKGLLGARWRSRLPGIRH